MNNLLSRIRRLHAAIAQNGIAALKSERRDDNVRKLSRRSLFGNDCGEPESHGNSWQFPRRPSRARMSRVAQIAQDLSLQATTSNEAHELDVAMFRSDLESMLASMPAGFTCDAARSGNAVESERVTRDLRASLENDVADAVRALFRSVDA